VATLPASKRETLSMAPVGALVTANLNNGPTLGLRIAIQRPGVAPEPRFVAFLREGSRLHAQLIINSVVGGNAPVVIHGVDWTLHVAPQSWRPDVLVNFGREFAGALIAQDATSTDSGLRLAVWDHNAGACALLRLSDWILHGLATGQQVQLAAAAEWRLSLPAAGPDAQWPLEA
jgi:hypothetical protein